MIKELSIKNFKSIKDNQIKLSGLNILTGLNGMGKSSLIQVLLLLNSSRMINKGTISLANEKVDIGKGRDALYQFALEEKIEFGITFLDGSNFYWSFEYDSEKDNLNSDKQIDFQLLSKQSLFTDNLKYLNAERISPKTLYQTSYGIVNNLKQIGIYGEFTAHFLYTYGNKRKTEKLLMHAKARSEVLIHQVEAWMSEISPGVKLNTTEIPGTEKVILDYQFETSDGYTSRFKPQNVGFGLTYTLPVITLILSSKPGDTIIIENPESHIHPRGQAELGKLLSLCASTGVQLIVETHSDHILNGIRVSVKEENIQAKDVNILFFDKKNEGSEQFSTISSIKVDLQGNLNEYPKNFMEEWNNQLLKLI